MDDVNDRKKRKNGWSQSGSTSLFTFAKALDDLVAENEEATTEQADKAKRRPRQHASDGKEASWAIRNDDTESWMITYMDMITLLLSVFVIMLGATQLHDAVEQVEVDNPASVADEPSSKKSIQVPIETAPNPKPVDTDLTRIQDALRSSGNMGLVDAIPQEEGISLRIKESALFPSGEAALSDDGRGLLGHLFAALMATNKLISVEGHTDNVPIATEMFPSNWELSSARADEVVRYLIQRGMQSGRLRAIGYADTRAVADNETPEGRARNRRVNIVIHNGTKF